jgi:pimeloyl-ACP methyl ester carboxylesterase
VGTGTVLIRTSRGAVGVRVVGAGPPVLLLHGIPGRGSSWDAVSAVLSATRTVLVPDLLGFGASDRPTGLERLHAAAQAQALAEVLDELAPAPVTVVGHDFGGPVAVLLHRERPRAVAGLALLATNTFADTPVPFPLSLVRVPLVGGVAGRALFCGPALAAMLWSGTGTPRPRLDADAWLADPGQRRSIRTIFAGSLTDLERLYRPVQAHLPKIAVPTLVGWGDRDPFFPVAQGRRTAAAVPGARFRLYAGTGHFLPAERPAELADDIAGLGADAARRR